MDLCLNKLNFQDDDQKSVWELILAFVFTCSKSESAHIKEISMHIIELAVILLCYCNNTVQIMRIVTETYREFSAKNNTNTLKSSKAC